VTTEPPQEPQLPQTPAWFDKWRPVVATTVSFIVGTFLLVMDRLRGNAIGAPEVVLYLALMGQLPIALVGQLLGWKK